MNKKRMQTPSEAWAALKKQVATGKPQPEPPARLPLTSIKLRPEVFQQRKPAPHASQAHVRALGKSLGAGVKAELDPLAVWWDGRGWTCIDGHHRMAAYQQARERGAEVPVEVFEGAPEAALAYSARANTKDKLAMSRSEKMNAAWKLVVIAGDLSRADVAEASGASSRHIATMRSVKRRLEEMAKFAEDADPFGNDDPKHPGDPAALTWDAARRLAAGEDQDGVFDEDARVDELATKLRKALGPTAERQPGTLRKGLGEVQPDALGGAEGLLRGLRRRA
jgi:hypothetical protein